MLRSVKFWIAIAATAIAAALGVALLTGGTAPLLPDRLTIELIPDQPADWHGKIDYHALDRQFAALAARPEMAGLAVAIVENGELRFVRGYGVADRENGTPVTPQTVFRWASVSKTATGMLAARLAGKDGQILNRPIASWATSLRLPEGSQARVTLAQLLAQQTGLTKNAYDDRLEGGESPGSIRTALALVPQQCPPATCHTYQNIAFDAASEILAQVAGERFEDAVGRRFFRPLGMASASYGMAGLTQAEAWARPYRGGQLRVIKEAYWRVPAAAGVNSNIVDFAKWMRAAMGERPKILSASTRARAQTPRVATARPYSGELARALSSPAYGLGWRSFAYGGHRLIGHSGAVDGYRATMIFEPATRTGVVAMWNSDWGRPFQIPFAVFDDYHKAPNSPWLDLRDFPPAAGQAP